MRQLCRLLKVSRSWWYEQRAHGERSQAKEQREEVLAQQLRAYRLQFRGYGYRRMTQALRRAGEKINGKHVLRLMREHHLLCRTPHHRRRTTVPGDANLVAPNLLADRRASRPNEIWVSDITYIHLPGRFAYLATVLDLHTRVCVGWQVSERLKSSLVLEALRQAVEERHPPTGLILHSDRGCQYTSHAYQELARAPGRASQHVTQGDPIRQCLRGKFVWHPQTRRSR